MSTYPAHKLYEEIGFLAYYFHWSHEEIMNLEHGDRRRYCEEVSRINQKLNASENEKRNVFDVFNKAR